MNYQHKNEPFPTELIGLIFKFFPVETIVPNYSEILDILLNKECFIVVYNIGSDEWNPAVYINHFAKTQRIMVEYMWRKRVDGSRFHILKDFPINYVRRDADIFKIKAFDLRGLPQDRYDDWIQRNHSFQTSVASAYKSNNISNGISKLPIFKKKEGRITLWYGHSERCSKMVKPQKTTFWKS